MSSADNGLRASPGYAGIAVRGRGQPFAQVAPRESGDPGQLEPPNALVPNPCIGDTNSPGPLSGSCERREKNVAFRRRTRSWKRSTDPLFEEKATCELALYRTCPADGVVVCFNEFGRISLQPYPVHCYAQRKRPWRYRATYVRRSGVGYFFGAYDFHADVLVGGYCERRRNFYPGTHSYRLAKTTSEVLAFYKHIRRRYPDHLRIYLINDNLMLHWTPRLRQWAELHNVGLVAIPTYASYFNRIECQFQPLREFVINASDCASHAEVAHALRRYVSPAQQQP